MVFVLRILVIFGALTGVSLMHGQSAGSLSTPPLCKPADIDATFYFADTPAGHQVIAINLRNISPADCRLRDELAPNFSVDGHAAMLKTCWLCKADGGSDREAIKRNDSFVLNRDATAHVMYRWSSTGAGCPKIEWGNFDVDWDGQASYLFEADRWKPHVCSEIEVSGYEPGLAPGSEPIAGPTLRASIPSAPLYGDERTPLTLTLESPDRTVVPAEGCPDLYVVYDNGPETTRFAPLYADDYNSLVRIPSGLRDFGNDEDLHSMMKGYTHLCNTKGAQSTTVVTLAGSNVAQSNVIPFVNLAAIRHITWRAIDTTTHQSVFVSMDAHFVVLDPATLPQNWGPRGRGIAAGLSIDKDRFAKGETIPLHVHWENFSASQPLGVTECGDPWPRVELQDARHHVLKTIDTGAGDRCMGHGWGPSEMQPGNPWNYMLSLKQGTEPSDGKELPISAPGTYYLVTVWSPRLLVKREPSNERFIRGDNELGAIYATVRSEPVRVEIR